MKITNKKNIILNIIAAIEVLLVLSIFVLFYLTRKVYVPRILFIPKGNTNYTIKTLQKNNLDISKMDKIFLIFLGHPQAGWLDLKGTVMTKADFLYRFTHDKAALENITIVPGETNYFIYKDIAKKLKINNFYCNIDEGFLVPNTYRLPIGMKRENVCKYLYNYSLKWHKIFAKKIFGIWNYKTYKKYLIIASIIQKEAANTNEMKYISAVIYNRLTKHMKLQMDGSLNYGMYSYTPINAEKIRRDNSLYNTYKHYGLPLTPVCVVSKKALLAAIFPAKVNYLYFLKCGKGTVFSNSYKGHLRNIKRCK